MKILEVTDRTPDLINWLLKVWESSVRATQLFLSDDEIKNIKKYVPQALNGIENYAVEQLTVNGQNPQARGFYKHMGFHVYKRTACPISRRPTTGTIPEAAVSCEMWG